MPALLALLLLPGLLVVRAPWWAVPFLSLSYWWASWAWLPPSGPGRLAFLGANLPIFGVLLLFRLVRLEGATWPEPPTLAAILAALAGGLPAVRPALAPAADLSFDTLVAQLLVWRDGIPISFAPLLDLGRFRTHAPGLPFLAADAALLSGGQALAWTQASASVAPGLLALAVFAAARRWARPWLAAALAAAAAPCAWWAIPAIGASWISALAFLAAALALTAQPLSRARAVAFGSFLGAVVLADARAGIAMPVPLWFAMGPTPWGKRALEPLGPALLAAAVVAGPAFWRLA